MSEQKPRRRTRSNYDPSENLQLPQEDAVIDESFPETHDPDAALMQGLRYRISSPSNSLFKTRKLLRGLRPESPFRRPHGIRDFINIVIDVLVWLPKLVARLVLYACRYLRSAFRYAAFGVPMLHQAFLLAPWMWTAFYLLLALLTWGGIRLLLRGTLGAMAGGVVLLLPTLLWGCALIWVIANAMWRTFFFSRWTFLVLEVLFLVGIVGAVLLHPLCLIACAPLPLAMLVGHWLLHHTMLNSFSPSELHFAWRERHVNEPYLREHGVHVQATVTEVHPDFRKGRYAVWLSYVDPETKKAMKQYVAPTPFSPEVGRKVHLLIMPDMPYIFHADLGTALPRKRVRKRNQWKHLKL